MDAVGHFLGTVTHNPGKQLRNLFLGFGHFPLELGPEIVPFFLQTKGWRRRVYRTISRRERQVMTGLTAPLLMASQLVENITGSLIPHLFQFLDLKGMKLSLIHI
jgi:hypothetical protein